MSTSETDRVRTLFEEWVAGSADAADVEALCRQHPEHAGCLRELHANYVDGLRALGEAIPRPGHDEGVLEDVLGTLAAPREPGTFRTVERIAVGGMSEVERVWDERLQRPLARKVLPIDSRKPKLTMLERRRLGRFVDEARIASQLQHPGILTVHEAGVDDQGRPFFVMPIVHGEDFGHVVRRVHDAKSDEWTTTRALQVLVRVCEAMAYAHDHSVIHRDLKPANIMVGRFGEAFVVDWGLAKIVDQSEEMEGRALSVELSSLREKIAGDDGSSTYLTMDGDVVGTPAYMAPEQAAGQADRIGKLADVYAVGAILYELLTGAQPYNESSSKSTAAAMLEVVRREPPAPVHELKPDVPAELAAICDKAMSRDPDRRYADMEALAEDLRAFLELRVVRAYETGAFAEMRKWVRRNRVPALAAAAGLIAVVGGLAAGLALQQRHRNELTRTNAALNETRTELVDQVGQLRRSKYFNDLAEVQRVLASGKDVGQVHRLLTECAQDLRGWEWRYLNRLADLSVRSFLHPSLRIHIAVSPDGKTLASVGSDTQTILWDVATGKKLRNLHGNVAWIESVAFSSNGRMVATTARDYWVRVWDVEHETPKWVLKGHAEVPWTCLFLDEDRLASAGRDRTVRIWDLSSGRELATLPMAGDNIELAVSAYRGLLAASGQDGRVRIWRLDDYSLARDLLTAETDINMVKFSSDGALLFVGSTNGALQSWDIATGQRTGDERYAPGRLGMSPDARWLVSQSSSVARVYDRKTTQLARIWHCPRGDASSIAFTGDSRHAFLAGGRPESGAAKMWDLTRPSPHRRYLGQRCRIRGLGVAPDGSRIASAGEDGRICIWKTDEPDSPAADITTGNGKLHAIAFSPDGRFIASVGQRPWVTLWDAETGTRVDRIQLVLVHEILRVAFSRDGSRLAIGTDANQGLTILELPWGGKQTRIHNAVPVHDLAFDRDAKRLFTGDEAGRVRVWNTDTGALLADWSAGDGRLLAMKLSPDGRDVAASWGIGKLGLYWTEGGVLRHHLLGHTTYVPGLEFGPGGRRLFSCSFDRTLRIWDTDSGRPVLVLEPDDGTLTRVKISADGRVLAASGFSGVVHAWVIDDTK